MDPSLTPQVERNTVWKDMMAMERRHVAAVVVKPGAAEPKKVSFLIKHYNALALLVSIATFATLLCVDVSQAREVARVRRREGEGRRWRG